MAAARQKTRGPLVVNAISLSAGGQWGAFGAGFLTGWSQNTVTPRPPFDLVTGVSAGAILTFYTALKMAHKEASDEIVTAINYSSLVLIAALNIMLGREAFSLQTLFGVTLVFAGLVVLSLR